MRKRQLGATGLEVTELALGTWGLSGDGYAHVPEAEQDRVIERARALGIGLFETADSYARGQMESRLGRLIGGDREALIVTKVGTDLEAAPPRKRFDPTSLRAAVERCRERQQRQVLDVVLLHNPSEQALDKGQATALLQQLKQEGVLRAWGVSAGSGPVATKALAQGAEVLQLAYNIFAAGDLNRLADRIRTQKVGVLARSVLAYGLLCGLWSPDKEFSDQDHRSERWTRDEFKQRIRQLGALRPLVYGAVPNLRAAALRFVLHNELVAAAVLGPRSALQLDQLVREAGREPPYLTPDAVTALVARLRDNGVES